MALWSLEIVLSQTFYLSHYLSHLRLGLHPCLAFSFDKELPSFLEDCSIFPLLCGAEVSGAQDLRFWMTSGPRLSTAGGLRLAWTSVAPSKPQRRVIIHGLAIFLYVAEK